MGPLNNNEIQMPLQDEKKNNLNYHDVNEEGIQIVEGINITKEELEKFETLDNYSLNEPYAYVRILRDPETLDRHYWVIEPEMNSKEWELYDFIQDLFMEKLNIRLDQIEIHKLENEIKERINTILDDYEIDIDAGLNEKLMYYIKRRFLGYGRIDPIMIDPNIEDISCDGSDVPVFLFHRQYGSLKTNVKFKDENELSKFVVLLAEKCGKHISIANPMLDATMPDGSRIQMTLSSEVTTRGSTFTIRKFRSDPITPTDLVNYNTMSPEIIAFLWIAVEHGVNALISGGTASGKTSALNAISLFIPRESKIVSIEETREINLPHKNWIPGVARLGFGERIKDRFIGEIDLFDLMKAALRQRPEYILVGEIRGKEAYVLFQAMATGHTTYSTVHADSAQSLIHRLEGKPIDIPRSMLQSLDIIVLQSNVQLNKKNVRRCKQIVEIIDVDASTKEILTNEVYRWDSVEDRFVYSGKSYVLEKIRVQEGLSPEDIKNEVQNRIKLLKWMQKNDIRVFKEFAKYVALYKDNPKYLIKKIDTGEKISNQEFKKYFKEEQKTKQNTETVVVNHVESKKPEKEPDEIKNKDVKEKHGFGFKKIFKKNKRS